MSSNTMTPNQREIIAAQSTISGKSEYLKSTSGRLLVTTNASTPVGATNFATGQASVTSSATQIVAANSTRTSVTVVNLGTTDVYIGGASVTTSTGQLLLGMKGSAITVAAVGAVYGIVGTGTQSVSYEEEYN